MSQSSAGWLHRVIGADASRSAVTQGAPALATVWKCADEERQIVENRLTKAVLAIVFGILILASFAGAVCFCATGFLSRIPYSRRPKGLTFQIAQILITLPSAVCDCLISAALAWGLRRLTKGLREEGEGKGVSRSSRRTMQVVSKVAWLTARTASYTAVVATVGGESFHPSPSPPSH